MKNLLAISCLFFAGSLIGTQYDSNTQKKPGQSYLYQLSGQSSQTGVYSTLPKGSLTEAEILVRLDKEGRDKFRSLSPEAKARVLELAAHTGASAAIEQVLQEMAQGQHKSQEKLLNNGMNRINRGFRG